MALSRGSGGRILALAINPGGLPRGKAVKPPVPKRLFTVEEAAVYLGRSPASIRYLVSCGYLEYVRMGKRIFFDREYLDSLIEESKVRYR